MLNCDIVYHSRPFYAFELTRSKIKIHSITGTEALFITNKFSTTFESGDVLSAIEQRNLSVGWVNVVIRLEVVDYC